MDLEKRVAFLRDHPAIKQIWKYLDQNLPDILASAVGIQQVPAPTFNELTRANHVLRSLEDCQLQDTQIDARYNVYGQLPGQDPTRPALLLSAHTDTVFPQETDLSVTHEGNEVIRGPGLGDNSLGVAAVIAVANLMRQLKIRPPRPIWFLANSCEEGLGDLNGIRGFYDTHGDQLGRAIVLEGLALGRIFHEGIAVKRLHVRCFADGGHSWQHFGKPTAIHHLLLLGAKIVQLDVPRDPRTTYNVGLISGGRSVNTLASEADFFLDMRSEDPGELANLESRVRALISETNKVDGISTSIEVVGDRPAGKLPKEHELVRGAAAALAAVGIDGHYETGSTDANLLLAKGLPTVTLGLTTGGNAHRLDEYINTTPFILGLRQVVLLTLAAADWTPPQK